MFASVTPMLSKFQLQRHRSIGGKSGTTIFLSNLAYGAALGTITYVIIMFTAKKEEDTIIRTEIPCLVWAAISLVLLIMTVL